MTREELAQYIKSELANDDTEIYLDIDDYKIIVKALEQEPRTKIEESNFSREQYVIDTNTAWKCGYEAGKKEQEPTTKNDLGVDAVSREAVLELIADYDLSMGQVVRGIHVLSPVTPQEPRWIPVNERLPEEREWYLAVFKESDTGFQLIPRVADYIGGGENRWRLIDEDGLVSEYRDLLECVAWMPLPQPYGEVEK